MNKLVTPPIEKFCVPRQGDPGAFMFRRNHSIHTGVDIYAAEFTPVYAVEESVVVSVGQFTGTAVGSKWYRDTGFVMAEGASGVVNYGEISSQLVVGDTLKAGGFIGFVQEVLYEDKGNGTSMLHFELYKHGTKSPVDWLPGEPCPAELLDPTPLLLNIECEFDCTLHHVIYHANPGCVFHQATQWIMAPDIDNDFILVLSRVDSSTLIVTPLTGDNMGKTWPIVADWYYLSRMARIVEWS